MSRAQVLAPRPLRTELRSGGREASVRSAQRGGCGPSLPLNRFLAAVRGHGLRLGINRRHCVAATTAVIASAAPSASAAIASAVSAAVAATITAIAVVAAVAIAAAAAAACHRAPTTGCRKGQTGRPRTVQLLH